MSRVTSRVIFPLEKVKPFETIELGRRFPRARGANCSFLIASVTQLLLCGLSSSFSPTKALRKYSTPSGFPSSPSPAWSTTEHGDISGNLNTNG